MSNFGLVKVKQEDHVYYKGTDGIYYDVTKEEYEQKFGPIPPPTHTWLERRVPIAHLDKINYEIDKYLERMGLDEDE